MVFVLYISLASATPNYYKRITDIHKFLNTKTHEPYSTDFDINVLQLNHIDKATEEDKAIAKEDVVMQEVGQLILELNTDDQTKELLEGRRRYREQLATSYAEGENSAREELNSIISEKNEQLKNLANENTAQANEIARLRKLLEDNGIQDK